MITKDNFKKVLENLGFTTKNDIYSKKFDDLDFELKADFKNSKLVYPENKGFTVNERQTCNFKQAENFVVFECVHRLLNQGYHPKHIELEPKWQVGHGASGGRADILVKDNDDKALLIIECKTAGNEFTKAWNTTQTKPTQIFSYVQQTKSTKFIALYASDFVDDKVKADYYLMNVTDNKELLLSNPKLKSFNDATTVEEIYQVWSQTYEKDYTTLGLFESNKPYDIGKTKFSINDLQPVSSKDIQEKYNKFATILRKYNVSGRENAFDKLVNLFLCKVVDETQNKDELKFYWKGKAYDNPFDFQDRLQQLYKDGMKKFLGEDITYIDNSQIDDIFKLYDLDSIKTNIKDVLKEQKFFTNNDFAFIDVHNEKLFYQNFAVLLEIARLIQDINLTNSDENQFLGDMFEGFLDQGVKQSEGQFFTPMPIVKFIINSLPKKENPKVIDYACGSGHFLNEYFTVNNESQIIGIEKEYRLSKVAKVSSFMYGSDMNIIYNDALSTNEKIKNNDFDVLIANPPYSVKGFLETLSQQDRDKFKLVKTIDEKSYTANNAIECFFIERSKQLLSKDAVAGIVVPSSILNKGSQNINTNKGNVYVGTREIILKYFDIVAIAEFGSGTFGKTGTNTVTLFLKRRCDTENLAGTFEELANKLFECKFDFENTLQDKGMLQKYCSHIEVDFDIYKSILCDSIDEDIFKHDIFKEYKANFEKLTETKNRKKKTYYKKFDAKEKEKLEQKELLKYIKLIEKDKFYYYCLAYKNRTDVVIVKSPSNNNENKKFLGYEWSSAKGNEGIHYITKSSIDVDDETLDEEDIRILENLQGLKDINTPLYNPKDSEDTTKINKIIKDNFDNIKTKIPSDLEKYVTRAKVIDMLDFSRVDFNKALSLSPSKKVEIESRYPLEKIEKIITKLINGSTPSKNETSYWNNEDINWLTTPDFNDENIYINSTSQFVSKKALKDKKVTVVPKNSVVITCTATIGKVGVLKIDLTTNQQINALVCDNKKVISEYLAYFMLTQKGNLENLTSNSGVKHINMGMLNNYKIPLPPLDIQEEIVKECQKVDDEVLEATKVIEQTNKDIENEISSVNVNVTKLGDIISEKPLYGANKKAIDGNPLKDIRYIRITDINENGYLNKEFKTAENIDEKFILEDEDFLFARSGNTVGKSFLYKLTYGKCLYAGYLIRFRFDKNKLLPKYLKIFTTTKVYWQWIKDNQTGASQPNINGQIYSSLKIPLPPLETQKQIVEKIEKLETKINEAKKVIDGAKELKEEILRKYL